MRRFLFAAWQTTRKDRPIRQATQKHARKKQKPLDFAIKRLFEILAERTGLEPATPGVTGR
ncbi:hypothetical protein, partial [Bordetella avium]|uniref:hypothetical protein n=1 Tax=Bordetella avium TaxID=521 RepID=UPI003BF8C146